MASNNLNDEISQLKEQVRFIEYEMDANNQFSVRKKTCSQVNELLQNNNFCKFNTGLPATNGGYDYLLKMRIADWTSEKVAKLQDQISKKEKERMRLSQS